MARPSFVLLRAMKPWRRRRRRFLGWYVRFGKRASSGPKKKWYLVVRPLPHGPRQLYGRAFYAVNANGPSEQLGQSLSTLSRAYICGCWRTDWLPV